MSTKVEKATTGVMATIQAGVPAAQSAAVALAAMERVQDERFSRAVPRFMTELPMGGDDDEITDRIAAQILVSNDPDAAQNNAGTTGLRELVNSVITVHDLRVMDGDLEGGWGAYLLLDCTRGDDTVHFVANTGAKQVVVRLARAWAAGELPVTGVVAAIANTGKRGTPALAFIVETPL